VYSPGRALQQVHVGYRPVRLDNSVSTEIIQLFCGVIIDDRTDGARFIDTHFYYGMLTLKGDVANRTA